MSLGDLRPGEAWRQYAACRGMPVETFYPPSDEHRTRIVYPPEAKATCNACPVRKACLDYAIANGEKYGMWGGKTPSELKKIRGTLRRCGGCGDKFHLHHGGLRYCPTCRPALGYM